MAYHTPPLKKAKKQGEMPLPILSPIPFQSLGMGWDCGWTKHFPLFLCFYEKWNMTGHH